MVNPGGTIQCSGLCDAIAPPDSACLINGKCGAARDTCTAGTWSDRPDDPSNYQWSCLSSNGGSDALNCSAPIPAGPITGLCGLADGQTLASAPTGSSLCMSGSPTAVAGTGPWTWTCLGSGGGGNSPPCRANAPAPGACGPSISYCSGADQWQYTCGCSSPPSGAGWLRNDAASPPLPPVCYNRLVQLNACGGGGGGGFCGDGIPFNSAGEQCDDGDATHGKQLNGVCPSLCSGTCTNNACGGGPGFLPQCSAVHYGCRRGVSANQVDGANQWTWTCDPIGVGWQLDCGEWKSPPSLKVCYDKCNSGNSVPTPIFLNEGDTRKLVACYDHRLDCSDSRGDVTLLAKWTETGLPQNAATLSGGKPKLLTADALVGVPSKSENMSASYLGNTVPWTVTVTRNCPSNCDSARQANLCSSDSYVGTDSCGFSERCDGTRTCDFNWKEIAP
ncbi:MAG: hypothetical protein ABI747_00060 [Candidatus Moraniibacteriota bacterium]